MVDLVWVSLFGELEEGEQVSFCPGAQKFSWRPCVIQSHVLNSNTISEIQVYMHLMRTGEFQKIKFNSVVGLFILLLICIGIRSVSHINHVTLYIYIALTPNGK